jgi:hypothetical protein
MILAVTWPGLAAGRVSAAPSRTVTVAQNEATLDFPNSVTFRGRFQSDSQITDVTLEYGTTTLSCGTVVAKAKPDFTPGDDVRVEWTWDMRQSGSLPPGATIWWQWAVEDLSGVTRTSRESVTWLDDGHNWKTISGGNANLHWYAGSQSFGQALHDAATGALERMETDTGLKADAPVDLYIYGDFTDMRDAILYEPGWTGGIAYPENNSVIIGIAPDDLEWGRSTIAHELTHVVVGHLTFSCLTSVPTWVNEGLAVYSEGKLNAESAAQLQAAIDDDTLLSVRSLSGGFSEVPGRAYLSYSESYSLVKFLVETYGRDKMTGLLLQLRDGVPIDEALTAVYGFDVGGLEDAWRAAIGAEPRDVAADPTALPTATIVPTIVPFAGVSSQEMQATQTSLGIPTATAIPPPPLVTPTQPSSGVPGSVALAGGLGAACCLALLILGLVIFLVVRNSRGGKNEAP